MMKVVGLQTAVTKPTPKTALSSRQLGQTNRAGRGSHRTGRAEGKRSRTAVRLIDGPNPEMLILARESRGYGQTQLAKKASVSQAAIPKFDSGGLEVLEDRLEDIA